MILQCADKPYRACTDESKETLWADACSAPNSGAIADVSELPRAQEAPFRRYGPSGSCRPKILPSKVKGRVLKAAV
jgi:hypothetical protein